MLEASPALAVLVEDEVFEQLSLVHAVLNPRPLRRQQRLRCRHRLAMEER